MVKYARWIVMNVERKKGVGMCFRRLAFFRGFKWQHEYGEGGVVYVAFSWAEGCVCAALEKQGWIEIGVFAGLPE